MKKNLFLILFTLISYSLLAQPFKKINEFQAYLQKNAATINKIEGLWEINKTIDSGTLITLPPYKVAIIKVGENAYNTFAINEMT